MDAKLVAGYVSSGSDFSKLPDVAAAAGLEDKEVNMIRYVVSAAAADLKEALTAEKPSDSRRAIEKIAKDLSVGAERITAFVDEVRSGLGLLETVVDRSALVLNNIGNNTYLGLGGLIFKPSKDDAAVFDMVRYTGEGGDVRIPAKVRIKDIVYRVECVAENTFRNTKVESVKIPEGCLRIETGAFDGCELLKSVTIPASLERIEHGAFKKCKSLERFEVVEGNKEFRADGYGILYTKDGKFLLQAPGALEGSVVLPEGLGVVSDTAFWGCSKVTEVSIPSGTKRIGKSAFSGCSSIARMRLPASIVEIGDFAFNGCSSLVSIDMEAGGDRFASEDGVLYTRDMSTLVRAPGKIGKDVRIRDGVETIGNGAFQGCEDMRSVTMGPSVRKVSDDAFKGCISLETVSFGPSVESIGKYAFMGCVMLEVVMVPDSARSMGTWAFGECKSLRKASVPASLELLPTVFPQEAEIERR